MNEDRTSPNSDPELTQTDSHSVLATALRRHQHTRSPHARGIYDNMIQILDPKAGVNPVMRPALLRRQMMNLERAVG